VILELIHVVLLLVTKAKQLGSYQCLVFVILTHGDNGCVYGKDSKYNKKEDDYMPNVPIRQLLLRFNAANCPALKNKPKIFIIQVVNTIILMSLIIS
jgi:hypothetical protein